MTIKTTAQNTQLSTAYKELLLDAFTRVGLSADEIAMSHTPKLDRELRRMERANRIKAIQMGSAETRARVFWQNVLLPLILREPIGADGPGVTYYPSEEYTDAAIRALAGNGLDIVIYVRLQQSYVVDIQPNTVITMSGLELLRYWGAKTKVANALGLNLRFIIGDESSGFPVDDILGFGLEHRKASEKIIKSYLELASLSKTVIVRPLADGIRLPLSDAASHALQSAYHDHEKTRYQSMQHALAHGEINPDVYRSMLFARILTAKGRRELGVDHVRGIQDIQHLPKESIDYLFRAVASFNALLDIRSTAKILVCQQQLSDYPEFWHPDRLTLHMGITRAKHRPSMLPIGKRWKGRYVMPAHGLPVYNLQRSCKGLLHHSESLAQDSLQCIKISHKVVGLIHAS